MFNTPKNNLVEDGLHPIQSLNALSHPAVEKGKGSFECMQLNYLYNIKMVT